MTILLTPDTVKKDTNRQADEQRSRVRDLSIEEDRLIKSVNDLRKEEADEKARLESEMPAFRALKEKEKADLQAEVDTLENRRKEAMKPIKDLRKEAEGLVESANARHAVLDDRETRLKEADEILTERTEKVNDRDQEQNERDEELDKREKAVKEEEQRSKDSAAGLAERWAEFHAAVHAQNAEFERRESAVATREQVTTVIEAEQVRRGEAQDSKDKELADRSATLERSAAEIRGLKQ